MATLDSKMVKDKPAAAFVKRLKYKMFECFVFLDYGHFGYFCRAGFGVWYCTTTTSGMSAEGFLVFGPGLRPLRLVLQMGL